MDSIVSNNSGLLGWPKQHYPLPVELNFFESTFHNKLPVQNGGGDYISVAGGVSYFNADGTIKWTQNLSDADYYVMSAYQTDYGAGVIVPIKSCNFLVTDKYVLAIGYLKSNNSVRRVIRLSLDDGSYVISSTNIQYVTFLTMQGGDLILTGDSGSTTGTVQTYDTPGSYRVNIETLLTETVPTSYFMINRYQQNQTTKQPAVALFDGALLLSSSSIDTGSYNSHDVCTVVFAINNNFALDDYAATKNWVQTAHEFDTEMFIGNVQQIGADLFVAGFFNGESRSITAPSYRPKFYTRAELERWASDCIFKTTGFKIPLSEGV